MNTDELHQFVDCRVDLEVLNTAGDPLHAALLVVECLHMKERIKLPRIAMTAVHLRAVAKLLEKAAEVLQTQEASRSRPAH